MTVLINRLTEIRGTPYSTYRWDIQFNDQNKNGDDSAVIALPYQGEVKANFQSTADDPDEISFVQLRKDFTIPPDGDSTPCSYELTFKTTSFPAPVGDVREAECVMNPLVDLTQSDTVDVVYFFRWYRQADGGISTFPASPV